MWGQEGGRCLLRSGGYLWWPPSPSASVDVCFFFPAFSPGDSHSFLRNPRNLHSLSLSLCVPRVGPDFQSSAKKARTMTSQPSLKDDFSAYADYLNDLVTFSPSLSFHGFIVTLSRCGHTWQRVWFRPFFWVCGEIGRRGIPCSELLGSPLFTRGGLVFEAVRSVLHRRVFSLVRGAVRSELAGTKASTFCIRTKLRWSVEV